MTRKTIPVWIVMDESGNYEVATDEDSALDRLKDASGEDYSGGEVCRIIELNVTMSEPLAENGSNAAVNVAVPDEAGRTKEIEIE